MTKSRMVWYAFTILLGAALLAAWHSFVINNYPHARTAINGRVGHNLYRVADEKTADAIIEALEDTQGAKNTLAFIIRNTDFSQKVMADGRGFIWSTEGSKAKVKKCNPNLDEGLSLQGFSVVVNDIGGQSKKFFDKIDQILGVKRRVPDIRKGLTVYQTEVLCEAEIIFRLPDDKMPTEGVEVHNLPWPLGFLAKLSGAPVKD